MTPYSRFGDPYATRVLTVYKTHAPELPDGERIVRALNSQDFDLLVHAVELTVQASAFSRRGIELALRLTAARADRLTTLLELLEVVTPGGYEEQRRVLVDLDQLANTLFRLYEFRDAMGDLIRAA
jgi:DNA segregation ATPase FtsK/SpoIIIE-like protein